MHSRPTPSEIPDAPGAYLFRNHHGEVMYVGKAKSLRKRIANYFGADLGARTRAMVDASETLEWIVTDSEVAALMLEFSLIKEHRPRFNIRLRDDKSFPYLAITRTDEFPRATVLRGKKRKGTQYFGPYAQAYAIRQTLDLLLRTFPVRTCSDSKYRRHHTTGRPCLLFHIERCSAPCVGEVDAATYAGHVNGLAQFLEGESAGIVDRLSQEMLAASETLEFERAARFRDQIASISKALARQEVVSERPEDFDLIALEEDDLEAAVVVLNVRRGRVVGRAASILDKVEDVDTAGLVGRVIGQLYGDGVPPGRVLVQELPPEPEIWEAWLTDRRGGRVQLRVPRRGAKRRLIETAATNAREEFARHRLRRQSDHNARARALRSLEEVLDLPASPLRIEAFDISTIQGTDTVASMVVLEDGLPRRNQYRRFRIRSVPGQDDFAAMEEVLRRRFPRYLEERELPVEERGRFAYPPSLVLVDGGAGQVSRAVLVLDELELDIPVAGLAKRMEEVYLPGRAEPVRIPRGEDALYALQRVRDEAHRFAVEYHRTLRGKRMVDSLLDQVPGIGPARKKALIRHFSSVRRMRQASEEELAEVVPGGVAADLYRTLHDEVGGGWTAFETGYGTGWVLFDGPIEVQITLPGAGPPAATPCDAVPPRIERLVEALEAYYAGAACLLPSDRLIGLAAATPLQRDIYGIVSRVLPGQTTTYGAVAAAAGRPGGARAVGAAMARNPFPPVIPCHRVIGSDGSLHGYAGGLEMKRDLLGMEGAMGTDPGATPEPGPVIPTPHVVVITGMSGAGRSQTAKVLEDVGYFVVDNLPPDLILDVVEHVDIEGERRSRLAVVVDSRHGLSFADLESALQALQRAGITSTLLFLDATDQALIRRYEEQRRPHPVDAATLGRSITLEREALEHLRGEADVIVDTTDTNVHELRQVIEDAFSGGPARRSMRVALTSFGFNRGVPRVLDLLFDVRFLPNPHWVPELRPLTGLDSRVSDYVLGQDDAGVFMERVTEMLDFLLPRYEAEGKSYLAIGIGCTGGNHRSVAIAEELGRRLGRGGIEVAIDHRDAGR